MTMELPDKLVEELHGFLCMFDFHTNDAMQPLEYRGDGDKLMHRNVIRAGKYVYGELCMVLEERSKAT